MATSLNPSISRRVLLGGAGAGLLALTGCGFGRQPETPAGTTTLRVWDSFTTEPANKSINGLYNAFKTSHAGTTIDRNVVAYEQMVALSKTALASGTGPDLIYYSVGKGNAGILVEAGLLAPLDDLAAKSGWKDKIAPFALREATFDGKLYGLPNESEVSGWWYNKTLLDKHSLPVPKTIDDVLTITKAAKSLDLIPVAYGQGDSYPPFWLFSQIACNIMQSGPLGELVYEDKGSWNTDEIIAGIERIFVELNSAGAFGKNVNSLKAQDVNDLWLQEKALMTIGGSWSTGEFAEAFPDSELGIMPMPALNGEKPVFSAGSGGAYWLSAKAGAREQSEQLLDFMFSDEGTRIWVEKAGLVPPVEFDTAGWQVSNLQRSVATSVSGGDNPAANLGYQVNHGLAAAPFLNMMTAGFQGIIAGEKTPKQQAADLQKAWKAGL